MMKDEHNSINYKNKTTVGLKEIFREIAQQKNCILVIRKPQFLIEANYLDIPKKCLHALTSFYACNMDKPQITVDNKRIVFDNIPYDLEPFIAGWLSRSILEAVKTETAEHALGNACSNIITGPIISNCAQDGSFACVWEQIGGNDWYHAPSKAYTKVCIVDLKQQTHCIHDINLTGHINNALCTLSSDKRHLLLITAMSQPASKAIQIYDLQEEGILKAKNVNVAHFIIEKALFNQTTKEFCIVAKDKEKNLQFMTINPASERSKYYWDVHKIPNPYQKTNISWSCVQDFLIGIDADKQTQQALLYKDNKLVACVSESADPLTLNAIINGKQVMVDYGLIHDYRSRYKENQNYYESEIFYIPDLARVMPRILSLNYKSMSRFDADNTCVNIIDGKQALTINFIPQKLKHMIDRCNTKLRFDDQNILPYAYATYCYYNHKNTWQEKCAQFLPYTPEISAILSDAATSNKNNATDNVDISSCIIS